MWNILRTVTACIALGALVAPWHGVYCQENKQVRKITGVQFLVTVNATFVEPEPCLATIKTPWLIPGKSYNASQPIQVGGCDHGPLTFNVNQANGGNSLMTVDLTFYSSVILDASPPTCSIPFNGTYLVPKPGKYEMSLLPHCYTADSREGYHMTYYWFKVFDWRWG